jgi:hypothetical protein
MPRQTCQFYFNFNLIWVQRIFFHFINFYEFTTSIKRVLLQGSLTEAESSVRLTSAPRKAVFVKKINNFIMPCRWFKLVSTRRSTVLILPLKLGFPAFCFIILPLSTKITKLFLKIYNHQILTFCAKVKPEPIV